MKIIGHRGARGLAPENTLESFGLALKYKVDGIECDVRVTRDGVPILAHDEHVVSEAGDSYEIVKHAYKELKSYQPKLPTLEEAIRFVDARVPLYVELKPGIDVRPVADMFDKLLAEKWQAKDFEFVSFDFKILKQLHRRFPEIGIVVNEGWSGVRACMRARRLGTKQLDIQERVVWFGFVKSLSRRGWKLFVYTQNDIRQAKRWQKVGLAGIITDYPDRFSK